MKPKTMGTYGKPCKECGARLDPGEVCECVKLGGWFMTGQGKFQRKYVTVRAEHNEEGVMKPLAIKWGDLWYEIDRVSNQQQAAALKAGGQGMRYTVRINGKETYLFFDNGMWFVEAKCGAA